MSTDHALLYTEPGGHNLAVVAVGTAPSIYALHAEKADAAAPGEFWMVRELEHELTVQAAEVMGARLTPRQRRALADLERDRRKHGRTSVRPAYASAWRGVDSYELAIITRSPRLAKLVTVAGVPYGPKTYTLTGVGRLVASAVISDSTHPAPAAA